jgi:hypothetical protein
MYPISRSRPVATALGKTDIVGGALGVDLAHLLPKASQL